MQVLVCKKPHHLELAHADKPECSPGHALVRIRSHRYLWDGYSCLWRQPACIRQYPRVPGHELAGEVVDVADDQFSTYWANRFTLSLTCIAVSAAPVSNIKPTAAKICR